MALPEVAPTHGQSRGEEIANSISHGIGLIAAVVAMPVLIGRALERGEACAVIGASVFAGAAVILYLTSTLYHAFPPSKAKRVLRLVEHSAIFLLIAGTYTPFALGVLHGPLGWALLILLWSLAAVGILLKVARGVRHPKLFLALYLAMGWTILLAAHPLWLRMPLAGLLWIAAGGLAYTAGVAFYLAERRRYAHFVWHLFVLAGTTCHFAAVLGYAE